MKIIIIGNGMVGCKMCEKLTSLPLPVPPQITVFGEEGLPAYDRVHLSEFFAGKSANDLLMNTPEWYQQKGIHLHLGDPVIRIDREAKEVFSRNGLSLSYDFLIIATGSSAFVPDIPGTDSDGVFVYRTIDDLLGISAYSKKARSGAVIGGGLLGLEAAKALLDLGLGQSHVVEYAPRLMPRQLDDAGASILKDALAGMGLNVLTQKNLTGIVQDEDDSLSLHFGDDSVLEVDMVIISAGIQPRDELAREAGIETGPRGGIVVNDNMQTSDPCIYAIGECALYGGRLYGLVAPGYEMADVVAQQLAGAAKIFTGFDMSTKLKLIGVDVASFGNPFITSEEGSSIVYEDKVKGVYKRINISKDGRELLGGVLVGDATAYNMLLQTCRNRMPLPANPGELIIGSGGPSADGAAGVAALPDEALICSCEMVTKASICNAVSEQGCETMDAVKKCTHAGSGCGGCVPMVKNLIGYTLKSQGKYVRNVICEHFPYSRQELYDLVKLRKIRSYDQVLDTFGTGDGCEVCRPVVSSLLASLWNEMILKKGNDTSQDSNDRFLANIQKGGTYSVVPRIPGGEITPDKLIVIGTIAKKYHLYTKITGGQRIDLFGAHLNDLPQIWSELIAAGFESGHAYGKALRTVKSCVGSTWCRFGLHDSVSYAIRIEERYRGLRAPHKIKSAVSGCIRECAEAQSKDFGIIATEAGWNLYVCGNGGSKPQHALLLASNLDSETCIRYIDRFLMFYIKTADPLTRTATWLNKMEGGIDYLRNVVMNDSLGIAEELEREMQSLVDSYKCEWKEVVENPELRKRFSHFVNAPAEKDPTVKFDTMREQKKALEWK